MRSVANFRYSAWGHRRVDLPGVREIGVVDPEQEARPHDRVVFDLHRLGDGRQIVLVALVVRVAQPVLDGAGRHRRQERLGHRTTGERRPEVHDVRLDGRVTDVGEGRRADGLAAGHVATPGEILRELQSISAVDHRQHSLTRRERALFDPGQAFAGVGREVALRLLAVVDDVQADGDLPLDDVGDRASSPTREGGLVVGTAGVTGDQQITQTVGPRQAAGMGGQDALGAAFHRRVR